MGFPLSPPLAEIFLKYFEEKTSNLPCYQQHIKLWRRYVDDVFAVFEGEPIDVQSFVDNLNKIHPNIKFTFEIETNNSLPFLDLKIIRTHNTFEFEIYRKPTTTSHVIPFNSVHPLSH